jgi:outer membrane receptor for ferrienterochelin and colicin
LQKSNVQLSDVVVRTSARRESTASLYTVQKNSSAISDAISAEVIKKSPDRTTSEVLRRVSGTSIQDNKFVIIRGLSERYNTSLLNNSVLPSTEPDKKAFSFDIIPSSLIDNITIYKSPTPDLPGDFAGGRSK